MDCHAACAHLEDLGRHVVGGANHGGGGELLLAQQLADAKVPELDDAIGAAEYVVGLEIPMYDALYIHHWLC